MTIKVGINGFGRMGRLVMRAAWLYPEIEFVQINDPSGDAATLAHLINFDSIHGRWQFEAKESIEGMTVSHIEGEKLIKVTANKIIDETDWSACDLVVEASGVMNTKAKLQAERQGRNP